MGLTLYSLGAVLFWPVAKASLTSTNKGGIFGGFVVCTAVVACGQYTRCYRQQEMTRTDAANFVFRFFPGLATLETSANSYVSVMPPIDVANFRLQFSQSFNGVASFTGPLIASKVRNLRRAILACADTCFTVFLFRRTRQRLDYRAIRLSRGRVDGCRRRNRVCLHSLARSF